MDSGYKKHTYSIISKIAYLIGLPRYLFEHQYEHPN